MSAKFKTAFVDFSSNFFDRHAIYCLSAYLKSNGIETNYVNQGNFSKAIEKIKQIKPDLLLYSAYSSEIPLYVEFDKLVKKNLGLKSVIGGPGPTFDWKVLRNSNSTIDALCVGEGEYALVDFIKNGFLPSKNIITNQSGLPSAYYHFVDLEKVSFPDRALVYQNDYVLRNMPNKQFLAGRGCPYMCTYCHNNIQNTMFKGCGAIIRKKSVDYLLEEIKEVKRRYPLKVVVFQDDTFILKRDWLLEFCERFPKEIGLPYTCNIRANLIDEETIKLLKKGNCACVYWSIESGNDAIRNNLLRRNMSREQILETGRLLEKYKLSHRCGGIIGLPGEKFEEMLETLELNIKVKPEFGFASIFVPFPGLELTNYALEHKYLSEELLNNLPNNTHLHSVLNFTPLEKLKIQKLNYLYPLFVDYPKLYYNSRVYRLLFKLPVAALHLFFNLYCGYKLAKLYKVKTPLLPKLAIMWRYLKNPF